jgi:DNA polymerase I-like protein with 3'-5' exonuclease and polymerase domains
MTRLNYTNDNKDENIFAEFAYFLQENKVFQLDVETTVDKDWCMKKLITVQIASKTGDQGFLFQWSALEDKHKEVLRKVLESWDYLKLAHNAMFELVIFRFYNIVLMNVYCTQLAEQVIYGGHELVYFSLSDLTLRYFEKDLDKTLQTSFGDDILTPEKIDYAYTDVTYLGRIMDLQSTQITEKHLQNTIWLEMRAILAFAECTYHGVFINEEKWKENEDLATPVIESSEKQLVREIEFDVRLLDKAIKCGFYSVEDRVVLNYNSVPSKLKALQLIFPDLQGASLGVLKKYISDTPNLPNEKLVVLVGLTSQKDSTYLEKYLLKYHVEEMVELGFLIPKNTLTINWNSNQQVLDLVQAVEPRLKSLNKESLAKVSHPIFESLEEYKQNTKLKSTYGMAFIEKHMEADGKVRTTYNPLMQTGRASSVKPNMQNIPAKPSVGLRYRNAFFYLKGWKFVDSDFTGQELSLIAEASKDDVWFTAIKEGLDLHSVTAAMVFGKAWDRVALSNCAFTSEKQKCKCPEHKIMRDKIKIVNFGLALTRNTVYLQHEKQIRRIKQSRTNPKVSRC